MRKPPHVSAWSSTAPEIISTPTAPALVEFLAAADSYVMAGLACYAQPALMFDGTSSGLSTRRFALIVPPYSERMRAWVTRAGGVVNALNPSSQNDTTISAESSTASGTLPATAAEVITTPPGVVGSSSYLGTTAPWQSVITRTGDEDDAIPSATKDRLLEMTGALTPTVELIEVGAAQGFGLSVVRRSKDLETL